MNSQSLLAELQRDLSDEHASVVSLVRRALQLAQLIKDDEHAVLFSLHLSGFDPTASSPPAVKWRHKDRQPSWDMVRTAFDDRTIAKGAVQSHSLRQVEERVILCRAQMQKAREDGRASVVPEIWKAIQGEVIVIDRIQTRVATFVAEAAQLTGPKPTRQSGRVFLGHGRSGVWLDLKQFLETRLGLTTDEFDREASAGKTVVERLEEMLEQAAFAFIVMTAENTHADGTVHARENVIHEVGLFQGALGRRRAIVLLEEGCEEFSNIHGLVQIRFPTGNVLAKSEEVRSVLEREGISAAG